MNTRKDETGERDLERRLKMQPRRFDRIEDLIDEVQGNAIDLRRQPTPVRVED